MKFHPFAVPLLSSGGSGGGGGVSSPLLSPLSSEAANERVFRAFVQGISKILRESESSRIEEIVGAYFRRKSNFQNRWFTKTRR